VNKAAIPNKPVNEKTITQNTQNNANKTHLYRIFLKRSSNLKIASGRKRSQSRLTASSTEAFN